MKFDLKYMQDVLGVNAEFVNAALEISDLEYYNILDSQDKKLSEITVAKLFALQETLEYAEDVFGGKQNAANWFHAINYSLGGVSPLLLISAIDGLDGIQIVKDSLGRIRHGLYS